MFQLYQFWEHWFPKSLVVPTVCSKWITIFFSWSHLWTDNDTSLRTRLQHSSKKKARAFSDFGNRNHICRISWIYYNSHIHFFGTWVWPAHTNQCSRPRFSLFSTGLHLKPLQVWPPNGKLRKDSSQSSCYLFFGPDAERIGVCFFFGSNRSCKSVSYIPHQTISRWLKDPPLKLLSGGHCLRGGASGPLSKVPAKAEELLMDWFKRDRALGEATGRVWFMQALSLLVADEGFEKKN